MSERKEIPRDWLADPFSKQVPRFGQNVAYCASGDYAYDEANGYWDFMPRNLPELFGEKWPTWIALQENGLVSYQNDPEHNLGIGDRPDFIDFARFCGFRGRVLDVGCGPQRSPTHFRHAGSADVLFVGLDALVGQQPRDFVFVLGVGEFLPFRSELFDQVLFVTSLDHFLDPIPPLVEARRVLRADGEVCAWIGEKDRSAPQPERSPEWYGKLRIPPGAEDVFHYRRFMAREFEQCAARTGLEISEKRVIQVDQWRKNIHYRLLAGKR